MGMPTVAVYILLAVLVAPAMTELGIVPLAAHLFIFYFGMMSMVTPPICMACFAAATIAESDPMKTGMAGMRLSIVALIVPFLFVLEPSLLFMGKPLHIAFVALTAIGGCYFLGAGLTGYFLRPLPAWGRLMGRSRWLWPIDPGGHWAQCGLAYRYCRLTAHLVVDFLATPGKSKKPKNHRSDKHLRKRLKEEQTCQRKLRS